MGDISLVTVVFMLPLAGMLAAVAGLAKTGRLAVNVEFSLKRSVDSKTRTPLGRVRESTGIIPMYCATVARTSEDVEDTDRKWRPGPGGRRRTPAPPIKD